MVGLRKEVLSENNQVLYHDDISVLRTLMRHNDRQPGISTSFEREHIKKSTVGIPHLFPLTLATGLQVIKYISGERD